MASQIKIAALYKFVDPQIDDGGLKNLREKLLVFGFRRKIRGTLILAAEGINGTVAGRPDDLDALIDFISARPEVGPVQPKYSFAQANPFLRFKVPLKPEIVTFGQQGVEPAKRTGTHVKADQWNQLLQDPDVVVIDTRNDYEYEVGTFEGALNPNTENFREFPKYIEQTLGDKKDKKIAMFCTGGIRCEKATSYMLDQGFAEVYQLEGGILQYLEDVPAEKSKWQGECFVFDQRVAVTHGLKEGHYKLCYACRMPLTEEERQSPHYIKGVQCPRCYQQIDDDRRARFEERQRQVELAAKRGQRHIGKVNFR